MDIRNIAIIAHVDHGKTTLVDSLLKQSDTSMGKSASTERIMDSNDIERERGITIFSKNAAVMYKGTKINIIDTPGHADFGGEVERVLKMADGVLLLIDAKDGPMPQTRFVLKKALAMGHKAIVVINKVDLKEARCEEVLNETFDLFVDLGATDRQTDFPVVYASAIQAKAGLEPDITKMKNIEPLFDTIIKSIPPPQIKLDTPLQMLVVSLAPDNYKGKLAIGRIYAGSIAAGTDVMHIDREGKMEKQRVMATMVFDGLARKEVPSVEAGDLVAVAGIPNIHIGDTIADAENPIALPPITIEKPTVKMMFGVNNSPFAGQEGEYVTSRHLRERLYKELETDVALHVEQGETMESFVVSGRGELHLAILIEKMRREGYEFHVSRPEVIFIQEEGVEKEPVEDVWVDVPEQYQGIVIEKMGRRRGEMLNMHASHGITHFHFRIPTRGLIGFRSEFLTDTRGTGIINTLFFGYAPVAGDIIANPHGSLVAFEAGISNTYGLLTAQERGALFIGPAVQVYEGMVVGQNAKAEDIEVNICRTKKLSNMRSKGDGKAEALTTPRNMSLEETLEYVGDDEFVEVTPKSYRIRKKILNGNERKRVKR
ncbi:translational GTPase TypA [Candidatus Uhrbacteria bacterium]|nr:translational GTPase TypA [Candidatus Uhrbacteria bacterium]